MSGIVSAAVSGADGAPETHRTSLAQRIEGAAGRALGRLPAALLRGLAGGGAVVIDGQTLDPEMQLIGRLRRLRSPYALWEPTPRLARDRFRREMRVFRGRPTPVASVRDLLADGPAGPIRVRHYAPPDESARTRPLLVFLHGGGFVIGDLDTHDEPCRIFCRDAGVHVASVEYRLAPEHPFPAALDDALAALRWGAARAASLGAAPGRVAVGGDSAGGNLATVASSLARGETWAPVAQLLVYPATDAVTTRPSQRLFAEGFVLTQRDREAFARLYANGSGVDRADPRISPLLGPNLGGSPPALVVTAGFDPLRDEGEAYADALRAAGTDVRAYREPSLEHGFVNLTSLSPAAHRATRGIAREWRAMLNALPCPTATLGRTETPRVGIARR